MVSTFQVWKVLEKCLRWCRANQRRPKKEVQRQMPSRFFHSSTHSWCALGLQFRMGHYKQSICYTTLTANTVRPQWWSVNAPPIKALPSITAERVTYQNLPLNSIEHIFKYDWPQQRAKAREERLQGSTSVESVPVNFRLGFRRLVIRRKLAWLYRPVRSKTKTGRLITDLFRLLIGWLGSRCHV